MGQNSRKKKEQRELLARKRANELSEVFRLEIVKVDCPVPWGRKFYMGECEIFIAQEPHDAKDKKWHMAIACSNRYPTWEEICRVRYEKLPSDIQVAMFLPTKKDFLKFNNNCFHLFEVNFVKNENPVKEKEA